MSTLTSHTTEINALLAGLQIQDPRLFQILSMLAADNSTTFQVLFPIQSIVNDLIAAAVPPLVPTAGIFELRPNSVHLAWTAGDQNNKVYEVREGTDWDTAFFRVATLSTQVDLDPTTIGTHTYLVKSINSTGAYSVDFLTIVVVIPTIEAPIISPQVIDNNVLLRWNEPVSTFIVDYYNVYKDGVLTGFVDSTFISIFETVAGTFIYGVEAVDIAGNVGARGTVTVFVNEPPDFLLADSRVSDLSGTRVNVGLINGRLIAVINTTETWAEHFTSHSWTTPQDQIDAGYPIFIQPSALTGYYEEIIDYGSVFTNLIVNLDWSTNPIVGTVSVTSELSSSVDGSTYTPSVIGQSSFFESLRYVKLRINFTAVDDKSLIEFYNLRIFLNAKLLLTSGTITVTSIDDSMATPSTHAGGAYVPFIRPYKSVNSITLTTNSAQPITPIFDFIGIPNPDGFKVLVFDSSGNRIGQEVAWKVRGIL